MQYWTQLLIAFHLSVDVWTLFYCLLCTVCFIVCCNPAFLAAKSNKGYYYIINRSFVIAVFVWSPDSPAVNHYWLVRLWHNGGESTPVTFMSTQCHCRRPDVTDVVREQRQYQITYQYSGEQWSTIGKGPAPAAAAVLYQERRRRAEVRRQRRSAATSSVVPQRTTVHAAHTAVVTGLPVELDGLVLPQSSPRSSPRRQSGSAGWRGRAGRPVW